MPLDASVDDLVLLERSEGRLEFCVSKKGHTTGLVHLLQDGCLKARFPQMHEAGPKRGVLINTTGGIADGDKLTTYVDILENAELALTTQAAERVYRARDIDKPASIDTSLKLHANACLYWLPQETILFDGGAVHRKFDIEVAEGAQFLGCEMIVLGRTAMSEQVARCNLFDRWRIRVGGKLAFADGFKLGGEMVNSARGKAQLANSVAYASLFYIGADAEALKKPVRDILEDQSSIAAGCSLRGQVLVIRFASQEAKALRRIMAEVCAVADQHMLGSMGVTQAILPRWIF